MRVIVIGAGVIGAAVGYQLAAGGADVTIVEAGEPAGETSRRSFAWLNGNDKPPPAYQQLNQAGVHAHRRLAERIGGEFLHQSGQITFAIDAAGAAALAERVARVGGDAYPAEMIEPARAAALEPQVRFDEATAAAWFPLEGWADGPRLVGMLVDAATALGARLLTRRRVVAIEKSGGLRVAHVAAPSTDEWPRNAAGESPAGASGHEGEREWLAADRVVIAGGRFSDGLTAMIGFRLPLAPTCGLLAVTSPVSSPPRVVIYAPGVHFRQDGGGRLLLQSDDGDASVGPDSAEDPAGLEGCGMLLERARHYVPALVGARIEAARVGIRPMPADGLSVAGPVPGAEDCYLVVTHSGMTLGPLLGEIAASEVLEEATDARLALFRPGRFLVDTQPARAR